MDPRESSEVPLKTHLDIKDNEIEQLKYWTHSCRHSKQYFAVYNSKNKHLLFDSFYTL